MLVTISCYKICIFEKCIFPFKAVLEVKLSVNSSCIKLTIKLRVALDLNSSPVSIIINIWMNDFSMKWDSVYVDSVFNRLGRIFWMRSTYIHFYFWPLIDYVVFCKESSKLRFQVVVRCVNYSAIVWIMT